MKFTLILIVLSSVLLSICCQETKDDVVGFGLMINKVTGRNPLDFCGYGNYCGRGGSGIPVDRIDKCCKVHDECYGRVGSSHKLCWPHLALYTFSYDKAANKISCSGVNACSRETCACDSAVALCFKANAAYYNSAHKGTFFGQLVDCITP